MSVQSVLATLVLFLGVPLNLLVTVLLMRQAIANPGIRVLTDRLIASIAVLLMVIVFGFIFLNNDSLPPMLTTDTTRIITRFVLLCVAVIPALYWLSLYWRKSW